MRRYVGGNFAPPMDTAGLQRARDLAADQAPQVREYMERLADLLAKFRETPDSTEAGSPHPSGRGTIVPLEAAEKDRIELACPYREELDLMGQVFDQLTGEVRNAAYHLLWYARELRNGREPITNDKI